MERSREVVVNGKMRVMIDSPDHTMWGKISRVLESKGIDLVHFRSVRQACEALSRKGTLLVFRENRLVDGTYEDLLIAAKEAGVRTRIVVAPTNSKRFDSATYSKAKELGAFDVLRECYGPKDLEWVVICAIRDKEKVRATAAWRGQG
jgi:DNA-binding NtrC family response regulator